MTERTRKNVGVVFGGVSPEHEVSIISAMQAMAAMNQDRWRAIPIYLGKDGIWWMGEGLRDPETFKQGVGSASGVYRVRLAPAPRGGLVLSAEAPGSWIRRGPDAVSVDIVLPILHGGTGEDGSLQGLCETLGVPYAGSGPLAAALAMDKVAAKRWAASHGIPQVDYATFGESEWAGNEESRLDELEVLPGLPAIVKPAGLGSSIGIGMASSRDELDAAIEEAFRYDDSVVVEKAVQNLRELNCSVLGTAGQAEASVLEEPLSGDALLSFQDKYMRGGGSSDKTGEPSKGGAAGMASLDRQIPARVGEQITAHVREMAVRIFEAFGCSGLVRIDFLMDGAEEAIFFNEINTMPGSLAFYLWDATGVTFPGLLDRILDLGLDRHQAASRRVRSYDVNLLSEKDLGGLKGTKK